MRMRHLLRIYVIALAAAASHVMLPVQSALAGDSLEADGKKPIRGEVSHANGTVDNL